MFSNNSTNQLQEHFLTVGELRFFAATMEIKKARLLNAAELKRRCKNWRRERETTIGAYINDFAALAGKQQCKRYDYFFINV